MFNTIMLKLPVSPIHTRTHTLKLNRNHITSTLTRFCISRLGLTLTLTVSPESAQCSVRLPQFRRRLVTQSRGLSRQSYPEIRDLALAPLVALARALSLVLPLPRPLKFVLTLTLTPTLILTLALTVTATFTLTLFPAYTSYYFLTLRSALP